MQWLDSGWAEHVGRFEGEAWEGVFGLAFDAGPHGAALFRAVGSGAGNVDEGHGGIEAGKSLGHGHGHVIRRAGIVFFGHARGRGAGAEKASIVTGEIKFDRGVVEKVFVDKFREFCVLLSGGAEEDDVHVVSDAGSRRKGLMTRRPSKSWPDCRSSVRRKRQEADFAAETMSESQKESW